MGLAIDVGQLRLAKQQLQMTADAAALAGALELSSCGGSANCSVLKAAAQDALTENNLGASTLLTDGSAAGHVLSLGCDLPDRLGLSLVSAITPHLALLAMQQLRQHVVDCPA